MHTVLNRINSYFSKFGIYVLCITVFFIRLPPFYLVPIPSSLVTSHSLARYLAIVLFITGSLNMIIKRRKTPLAPILSALLLLYFTSQSISILKAINIESFLIIYKNLTLALLIFICTLLIADSHQKINKILTAIVVTITIELVYQLITYIQSPSFIFESLKAILYERYWDAIELNLLRDRFFVDIYNSALLPIFFYYLFNSKKQISKIFFVFSSLALSFFSIVSNFRTQVFMLTISYFGSVLFLINTVRRRITVIALSFILLIAGHQIGQLYSGQSALTRIFSPEEEEYATISGRITWWSYTIEMARLSPVTGIGLGNYYDYLPYSEKKGNMSLSSYFRDLKALTLSDPHNIFFVTLAETGILGLISLISLIIIFVSHDIKYLQKNNRLLNTLIISFWSLSSYSLFNPSVNNSYLSTLWLLRGLIEKVPYLQPSPGRNL